MAEKNLECPNCHEQFPLSTAQSSGKVTCPHCQKSFGLRRDKKKKPAESLENPQALPSTGQAVETFVANCPACAKRFRIPRDAPTARVACPHCQARHTINELIEPRQPDVSPTGSPSPPISTPRVVRESMIVWESSTTPEPSAETKSAPAPAGEGGPQAVPVETRPTAVDVADPIDAECAKLLPPKFLIPPESSSRSLHADGSVLLPDSEGNFRLVDTSVRAITFGGKTVAVKAMSPGVKRRRRAIRTLIVFALCTIILLIVFRLLLQTTSTP